MTARPSSKAALARRRYLALAAAVASAASLDEAAPVQYFTVSSPPQVGELTAATPSFEYSVQVTASNEPNAVELTVSAQGSWDGGADAPVLTATLGPDQGNETEGGVPPDDAAVALSATGTGAIAVAAGQACGADPCTQTFTLTLSEAPPAQRVLVVWTATATIATGGNPPDITITVTP